MIAVFVLHDRKLYRHVAGEASASTMWDNNAWVYFYDNTTEGEPPFLIQDFVHALQPHARFIVMLRDPVERWEKKNTHPCNAFDSDVMLQMSFLPTVRKMMRLIYRGISLFVLLKYIFHICMKVIHFHEI